MPWYLPYPSSSQSSHLLLAIYSLNAKKKGKHVICSTQLSDGNKQHKKICYYVCNTYQQLALNIILNVYWNQQKKIVTTEN